MNPFMTYLKKLLIHACVSYTVLTMLLFLLGAAFPVFGNAIEISSIFSVFGFSVLLGGANFTLSMPRFAFPARLVFHYLASLLAFYVVFVLIGTRTSAIPTVVALLLLFTILYVITMGAYILIRNTIKHAKAKDYERQYRQ